MENAAGSQGQETPVSDWVGAICWGTDFLAETHPCGSSVQNVQEDIAKRKKKTTEKKRTAFGEEANLRRTKRKPFQALSC